MSLLEPYVPAGFDDFWAETTAEALSAPLDISFSPAPDRSTSDHLVQELHFRSISGIQLHGWTAEPLSTGRYPAFLWVPPYSRWSMKPNEYGIRKDFTSLSFNFFGESSFHDEVYQPSRGYFAEGVATPETWIFRRMFQDSVIAARILEKLDSVDSNKIGSMGMSQGGGISIWLAAFVPQIKAVCADMPFLGAIPWVFASAKHFRYPLKELTDYMEANVGGKDQVDRTISYFDTMNVATRCTKPVLVTAGLKDPAVKTEQVVAIYNALQGPKQMEEIDWGHDWHPSMVERNSNWLTSRLAAK